MMAEGYDDACATGWRGKNPDDTIGYLQVAEAGSGNGPCMFSSLVA
jgi:hypothetical protein